MASQNILTFDECLKIADDKKHLILGNGFSIALFPKIFNYKKLAERISNHEIKNLFAKLNTNDFEFVMRRLFEAIEVLKQYENSHHIHEKISLDLQQLKRTLIEVITESHPDNPRQITEDEYKSCQIFLKNFAKGRKYSLNYDLILYWVYMHFLNHKEFPLQCNDGFVFKEDDYGSNIIWEIGKTDAQDLYYIHGAIHLFSNGCDIEKYTWINNGVSIKNQVHDSIKENKYPIFISEGSSRHKLARIGNNGYLTRALVSIPKISGDLFIFGHSLRNEDDHVFNLVNKNTRLKKIFISLFKNDNGFYDEAIIEKVKNWRLEYPNRNYILYDAASAKVWNNGD